MENMHASGIDLTIYFYNPNIHPRREYDIRKEENIRFAQKLHIPFIDADYDRDNWFVRVKGPNGNRSGASAAPLVLTCVSNGPHFMPTKMDSKSSPAVSVYRAGKTCSRSMIPAYGPPHAIPT